MATKLDPKELDMQGQLAAIRRDMAEISQRRMQTTLEPWKLLTQATIAAAGLLGAGAALGKLFFP